MVVDTSRLNALFQLYLKSTISKSEFQELCMLLNSETISAELSAGLKELWFQSAGNTLRLTDDRWDDRFQFLLRQLNEPETAVAPVKKLSTWHQFSWVAASILLLLFSSSLYYLSAPPKFHKTSSSFPVKTGSSSVVIPGGNHAVLILSDGTSIVLDSSSNGTIASQGSTKIIKLNSGQLAYNSPGQPQAEVLYNTLSTPRGGKYQVTLADGTVVWLNSESSLRYPTVFKGTDRKVEISGEAYFEVAKNPGHPFKVHINVATGEGGEVEVLGTHFNVNAFDNEATIRTTLFEGSIRMNRANGVTPIKPGQQLQAAKDGKVAIVNNADLESVIAWKEDRFQFEDADLKYVMRQIARWYDIEVAYKGNITTHFDGSIPKNVNVVKVLNMLELTGEVKFTIEGRKVVVLPQ